MTFSDLSQGCSRERGRPSHRGCDRLADVTSDTAALYDSLRPLLFSIAYRMLGTVSEAEDVLQEAFLRFHRAVSGGT